MGRNVYLFVIIPVAALFLVCCNSEDNRPRILIFIKEDFSTHESTPVAAKALISLCGENGFSAEVTDDESHFSDEFLKDFVAVVFLNTAGNILNPTQEAAFERYILAGGGFIGIHSAVDTEHQWEWYGKLIGARFDSQSKASTFDLLVADRHHQANLHFDSVIRISDEQITLKDIDPDIQPLLTRKSLEGHVDVFSDQPVSWYRQSERSRIFITTLGHTAAQYANKDFLAHLSGAIAWVAGQKQLPDYSGLPKKDADGKPSDRKGYIKTVLAEGFHEPMQMDEFPDGNIIIIERRGAIKIIDAASHSVREIHKLDVFSKHEEGLLGVALDPGWVENKWVYLLYTPENDHSAIRLSRFECHQDRFSPESEKVILQIPTLTGYNHYHAAGCLTFDEEGFLYIATGDNTKDTGGFSTIDDRSGREYLDAQRTSANSMDLKGKVLRIKPLPDGSYVCPAGNLYVNGDVIIRNGKPATHFDWISDGLKSRLNSTVLEYEVKRSAAENQTGLNVLTAQHMDSLKNSYGRPEIFAMGFRNPFRISVDERRKFVLVGDVGPDAGKDDSLRGPEGYDELNIVRKAGYYGWPYFIGNNRPYRSYDFNKNKPGSYFDVWNPVNTSRNNSGSAFLPPARSAEIWYPFRNSPEFPALFNGTRCIMAGPVYYKDRYTGSERLPDSYHGRAFIFDFMRNWIMAVSLDSAGRYSHMEQFAPSLRLARPVHLMFDKHGRLLVLEYGTEWYAKNEDAVLSRIEYHAQANAADSSNSADYKDVSWDFSGQNKSFYQEGQIIRYRLRFNGKVPENSVSFQMQIREFRQHELSLALNNKRGERQIQRPALAKGQLLIDQSDCRSCHALDRTINGPSYPAIAARYKNQSDAEKRLTGKIIDGGSGNWGNRMMIAHPQLNHSEAREMAKWILSLSDQKNGVRKEGRYTFPGSGAGQSGQRWVLFDVNAANGSGETIWLRPAVQQAEYADSLTGKVIRKKDSVTVECRSGDVFVFRRIHLKGLRATETGVRIRPGLQQADAPVIEWRLNSAEGPLVGSAPVPSSIETSGKAAVVKIIPDDLKRFSRDEFADLYFIIRNSGAVRQVLTEVDFFRFETETTGN